MVESVAWITERKNVLSLVLYLGALLAYGRYAQWVKRTGKIAPVPDSSRGMWRPSLFYGLAFILFLGALLAKTTTFSLPAAILLIGWWKRGQIRWRADVLPTLPFFALALGLCAVTAWLEKYHVNAQGSDFALTFPQRCLIAGHAFWFYLGKLVWPHPLMFVYPCWEIHAAQPLAYLPVLALIVVLFILWLNRKGWARPMLVALAYFLAVLFPVLGFFNVYFFRYSFVADHFQYLASIGPLTLAAAGISRLFGLFKKQEPALCGALVVVLGASTWQQCGTFAGMETLWRTTLARNPDCWMAHNNLGHLLSNQGRIEEAMEHYHKAIQINPNFAGALYNLGLALADKGQFDEAIECYRKAIQINPNYSDALSNLGVALAAKGRHDEAIENYRKAIQINPNSSGALNNLAWVLAASPDDELRNGAEAVRLAERACELTHYGEPLFIGTLAAAYAESGRFPEAVTTAEKAEQLATTAGSKKLAEKNRQLLELYRANKPYHEPAPTGQPDVSH